MKKQNKKCFSSVIAKGKNQSHNINSIAYGSDRYALQQQEAVEYSKLIQEAYETIEVLKQWHRPMSKVKKLL